MKGSRLIAFCVTAVAFGQICELADAYSKEENFVFGDDELLSEREDDNQLHQELSSKRRARWSAPQHWRRGEDGRSTKRTSWLRGWPWRPRSSPIGSATRTLPAYYGTTCELADNITETGFSITTGREGPGVYLQASVVDAWTEAWVEQLANDPSGCGACIIYVTVSAGITHHVFKGSTSYYRHPWAWQYPGVDTVIIDRVDPRTGRTEMETICVASPANVNVLFIEKLHLKLGRARMKPAGG